ncbi:MAG: molybdate ABC transporter substrate-binding protein, partial [Phycisphaerales bacterium]
LCACAPGDTPARDPRPLVIFVAASMADAIDAIAEDFTESTGQRIAISAGASSVLARQIEAGAQADVYISADGAWMNALVTAGRIDADSRTDLAGNRLVVVAAASTGPISFDAEPPASGRIALADPSHVPAGRYAREALESLRWWHSLEPRIVSAPDVRAALRLVEIGEAEFGFVYATDAARSDRVAVVGAVPASLHTSIRYPAAICVGAHANAPAFLAFLRDPRAARHLADAGFVAAPGHAP